MRSTAGAGRGRRWGGVPRSRKAKAQQDSTIRPSIHQLLPPSHSFQPPLEGGRSRTAYPNPAPPAAGKPTAGASGGGPAAAPPVHSFLQHRWREASKFSSEFFQTFFQGPRSMSAAWLLASSSRSRDRSPLNLASSALRLSTSRSASFAAPSFFFWRAAAAKVQFQVFKLKLLLLSVARVLLLLLEEGAPARGGAGRGGKGGMADYYDLNAILAEETVRLAGGGAPSRAPGGGPAPRAAARERPPHRRTAAA